MTRDAATEAQVRAADPRVSTWLSANAGSGKTRVLTDRVARLLFDGVDPQNILCLTYTKAAASEMQNRLFKRLGQWAMMEAGALAQELRTLGVEDRLDAPALRRARTLFARAIETPGGLRIQTIHSFCAGLLRRFPLEAGVSPRFAEMEDRAAALLRAEVVDTLALDMPHVVAGLAQHLSGDDIDPLLMAIAARRDAFRTQPGNESLAAILGVSPGLTPEGLVARTVSDADLSDIAHLRTLCATGSTTDVKNSVKLASFPVDGPVRLRDLEVLEGIFLSGPAAKIPFGAKTGSIPTKAVRQTESDLCDRIDDLMLAVEAARSDRQALQALDRTQALCAFAVPFVTQYEAAKLARGALDFDDLISKARALLQDSAVAQWVLFRLDGGIDHILVDEAQDTSPAQWAVIRALAQEFSAGEGARADRHRTIFVVGDKKQSIYSFQGADPEGFDRMRDHFAAELAQVGAPFATRELQYSFRSAESVLRVVDQTFVGPQLEGLGPDAPTHLAFKDRMPGRVDLWSPVEKPDDIADPDAHWTDPVDQVSPRHEKVRLADAIATEVKRLINSETETIPAEPAPDGSPQRRRITAGDFLILVQGRGTQSNVSLFGEIIRACKVAGIDIAGADRLRVGAELAVRDIAALLQFLALPEDDLSLAAALRSPLFGWSEQDLYSLAQPRGEFVYLWQALRDSTAHPKTQEILADLRKKADFMRPYDLINRILTRHDGRRRLLARLGPEVEDGIDALLAQALGYERSEIPTLTGFLEWLGSDELDIKRQAESAGDRLRVMTVHGAKGLEAPIVILPDTGKRNVPRTDPVYLSDDMPIWPPPVADMPPAVQTMRDAQLAAQARERRRLLYVAMTRAQSWLIVCAAGDVGEGGDSWHAMVNDGLTQAGAVDWISPTGPGRRFARHDWDTGPVISITKAVKSVTVPPELGPALQHPLVTTTRSPSDLGGAKVMGGETIDDTMDKDEAMRRGSLLHLLLEHLPTVPPDDRATLAARLIAAAAEPGDPPADAALVDDAMRLVAAPHLADLFADTALTEVDLTAQTDIPALRLHGAIDRLLITPDRILAVDYKTNRLVPDTPEAAPEGLLRQMGAYDAMLRQIWSDRTIEVAILWTATATLMTLPQPLISGAFARSSTA